MFSGFPLPVLASPHPADYPVEADSGAKVSFLRLPSTAVGNGCCSVVTVDFNGDGNTDIAKAYDTATIFPFCSDLKHIVQGMF
jgi:hypothetical protein